MSKKTKELRKRQKPPKGQRKRKKSGLQVVKFSFRPELSISSLRGLPQRRATLPIAKLNPLP